ncbi:heparinase II/III family protein [Arthrobacter koreensis]|uniref:heparinase II/III domain-containing protein n=1 Tax=Arthrobacter koreensis TaxID=199136 RepID=UPI00363FD109
MIALYKHVNYDVCLRQAFGGLFSPHSSDTQQASAILNGSLTMRPHRTWMLPKSITWEENPFEQRNWVFQFHTLRWMEPVRRTAMAGDTAAKAFWVETCKSWIRQNPPGAGKTRYAWGDMVDGIRALVMAFGLPMMRGEDHEWLSNALWQHGEWLADPSHLGHSNHALHQHQGLLVVGRVFDYQPWVDLAVKRMMDLFDESFDDQGVNAEGSIAYHRLNFDWWETAFTRLDLEGIERPENASRLKLALTELAYATKPNGQFERIGDTDVGGPTGLDSPELTYVLTKGADGRAPSDLTKVYKAGYVFGRSGWGEFERSFEKETFYSVSYGSANRVHGHQDGSSLTLHSEGSPWLVDAGKYAYVKDKMRDYCVRRLGHNVVHVENVPYDPKSVVTLDHYSLSDEVDDYKFTDKGYAGVTLSRRLIYVRGGDFFVVIDTVRSRRQVTAHQRWHLDHGTQAEQKKNGFSLRRKAGQASIRWLGKMPALSAVRGREEPWDGWMATDWMEKKETTVLSASRTGDRFRFVTVLGAGRDSSPGPEAVSMASQGIDTVMRVSTGRTTWSVRISSETVEVGRGPGVFLQPRIENPLGMALANIRHAIASGDNTAPLIPDSFSPAYWESLRTWVRAERGDSYHRRMMALERLVEYSLSQSRVVEIDNGLRAAILDLASTDLNFGGLISSTNLGIQREPFVSWSAHNRVVSETYGMPVISVPDGEPLSLPSGETNLLSVEMGGLTLPVALGRGSTDVLSVRFHGALNREKVTLPIFQGLTSEGAKGNHYAVFQDPSLDLSSNVNLAWFLGTVDIDLHQRISVLIKQIARDLGAKHVVLSGSSGGGFTALQVGAHIPEAAVLVFNPQTIVGSYHISRVGPALSACFGDAETPLDDPVLAPRLSVIQRYRMLNSLPKVLYVQNAGDVHHVRHHMGPFTDLIRNRSDAHEVEFVNVDWGKGHVSPSSVIYDAFLEKVLIRAMAT